MEESVAGSGPDQLTMRTPLIVRPTHACTVAIPDSIVYMMYDLQHDDMHCTMPDHVTRLMVIDMLERMHGMSYVARPVAHMVS
jgi:hypothetical protein